MADYILAIDQGTTGSTVALVDAQGQLCASVNVEFPQHFPRPGWVEHEPEAIWASVEKALGACCAQALQALGDRRIGITNQRETTVLWDRRRARRCTTRSSGSAGARQISVRAEAGGYEACARRSGLLARSLFQRQQVSLAPAGSAVRPAAP
jgi:glycerol kinase